MTCRDGTRNMCKSCHRRRKIRHEIDDHEKTYTGDEKGRLTMSSSSTSAVERAANDSKEAFASRLPIRLTSKVVPGFGRGSTELGIPTANLSRADCEGATDFDDLPSGIYWGFARIANEEVYKSAISIGFNPTYGNTVKTVEPHLIAQPNDERRHKSSCGETILRDFYGEPIRLSVVGYLRPELPFEGLDKLISAIKNDIVNAERLGDENDTVTQVERTWVCSDASPKSPS